MTLKEWLSYYIICLLYRRKQEEEEEEVVKVEVELKLEEQEKSRIVTKLHHEPDSDGSYPSR